MANNASARKRIRQTETRTQANRVVKSRLKTFRKQTLSHIEAGNAEEAEKAFRNFSSAADRAAKNNVIHKKTASRIKSRIAHRLKAM